MLIKWVYTILVVYFVMGIYWSNVIVQMVSESRLYDILLFILLGVVSSILGFGVAALLKHFFFLGQHGLVFLCISATLALTCVFSLSYFITKIVTIT